MINGYSASKRRKIVALLIVMQFLLASIIPAPETAFAAETAGDTVVRVGWYQSDMFQEGTSDDQVKSGYCYDYLQKVADYTSWTYEYVYGDWTELLHMLQLGEIDFLAGVSMTEERKETMLFPDSAMGSDQYYLYKNSDDNEIQAADLSSLAGKRAGGIEDNRMTTFTEQWIEDNGVDMEVVYFDSFDDQEEAFQNGEVDLLTQTLNNVLSMQGISIVAKVGEEPFYLAVAKSRSDLLGELNSALNTMLSVDPYILQRLQSDNYGAQLTSRTMTEAEKEWLVSHSSVTVGYLDNYLPFSDADENGKPDGVMTDVLDAIRNFLGLENTLSVSYQSYSNYEDMAEALKAGQIDIAFPVYGNLWDLEQDGINASAAVISTGEVLFYKDSYQKDQMKTLAVNENNRLQIAYCQRNFPDAQLKTYASIEACLTAVQEGQVDGTIVNTLRTELVTGNYNYKNLSYIQLEADDSRCFGVRENNTELLLLLNRGLRLIGSTYGIDNSYKYMSSLYSYGFMDFVQEHIALIAVVLAAVIGAILAFLVYNLRRKERDVRKKEEYIRKMDAINKELEELKRKAEAANNAKTTFLFNMSHDIRTPMNAIIGYTELISKNKENQEKLDDYIAKIRFSSDFLLSLINNVLELARIESGNTVLTESVWSVHQFNESLFSVFDESMKKKNIQFTKIVNVQHPYVYCDTVKLREIYLNILSNAYKYTPEGGTVCMELKELPTEREGYARFQITVTDSGIGISKEFLPHLFEEFAREKSVRSSIEGTGLGMPIVKKLVELMGGSITVTSELGKGTTFVLTLSHRIAEHELAEKEDRKIAEIKTAAARSNSKQRILLAEDNELNAEIAMELLAEAGFEVDRAEDGAVCVEMLDRADPDYYDLILMDVQMPNLNGYEATRKIRALNDEEKANIPIIAMTANAFDEDKQNAFAAGMNAHIAKPIDMKMLMQTLEEVLN